MRFQAALEDLTQAVAHGALDLAEPQLDLALAGPLCRVHCLAEFYDFLSPVVVSDKAQRTTEGTEIDANDKE